MKRPRLAGSRLFRRVVISTALPDGSVHRKYYHAPKDGAITTHLFPVILAEHRKLLEPLKFREVQTGANEFMFVHPARDKISKEVA